MINHFAQKNTCLPIKVKGYTLLECVIVLLLSSIIFSISVPSARYLLVRREVYFLEHHIQSASDLAISFSALGIDSKIVPIKGSWNNGFQVYQNDEVSMKFPKLSYGKLIFNRDNDINFSGIKFDKNGRTAQNGTFTYVSGDKKVNFVINRAGRLYAKKATN